MDINTFVEGLPKKAVKLRADGTYTVTPRMSQGRIDAARLAAINGVVQEFGLGGVRLTTGQRLVVDGVPARMLEAVIGKIGPVGDIYPYKVQACLGTGGCKLAMRDSLAMAEQLEVFLKDYAFTIKLKSGVSGCSMCCAESMIRDVGLIGRRNGWTVAFGGNGGKRVRQGDVLAKDVSDREVFGILGRVLTFFVDNAKLKERTARFVERVGLDAVKDVV